MTAGSEPEDAKRPLRWLGLVWVVLLGVLMFLSAKMQAHGRAGLLDFEFAGSGDRARQMLTAWGNSAEVAGRWAQWVDYGFIAVYVVYLTTALRRAVRAADNAGMRRAARIGHILVPAVWAAGVADAFQNTAQLLILGRRSIDASATAALVCGIVTSSLLIAAAISLGTNWFLRRRRAAAPQPT